MFRLKFTACIAAALLAVAGLAVPAAAEEVVVIRAARIVTAAGPVIDGGAILIKNGLIAAIGKDLPAPVGAKVINVPGGWVFPGFVDALTDLGAAERPGLEKDSDEATGPITPQLLIIDGVDPENPLLARARAVGTTVVLAAPALGNLLSGQSAVIRLAGDSIEEMTVKSPFAVHGSLGEPPKMRYGAKGSAPQTRMGAAALLKQTLWDVRGYLDSIKAYEKKSADFNKKKAEGKEDPGTEPVRLAANSKYEALAPVLKGVRPLVINANRMDDILTALRIADEFGLKLIISGGAEASRVAERLAARKIPVLIRGGDASGLSQETEKADSTNAATLLKAGVAFAFQTGSAGAFGDLLPQAQAAVAHGLPWEEALNAVTVRPASIFGVLDKIGTLEKGKGADLSVFSGNPFVSAARAKVVMIGGKIVVDAR